MLNQDFQDFFNLLNTRKVEYLLIGGVAYNFHAPPRATKDIDVWVCPEPENLQRLLLAIRDFGFPTEDLDITDLASKAQVLMLGHVPNRIDILTRPAGVEWPGAWDRRVPTTYGTAPVHVLGLQDLILAKRKAGRPRDLADVSVLEQVQKRTRNRPS